MGDCRIYDLLERFLSLYLLIEYSKGYVLEVHDVGIISIVLYLFLKDTENELFLILCLVCSEVDVCLLVGTGSYTVGALKQFSFYSLFFLFEHLSKVFVINIIWIDSNWTLLYFARILNAHEFDSFR